MRDPITPCVRLPAQLSDVSEASHTVTPATVSEEASPVGVPAFISPRAASPLQLLRQASRESLRQVLIAASFPSFRTSQIDHT